jgi:hypothetical protein
MHRQYLQGMEVDSCANGIRRTDTGSNVPPVRLHRRFIKFWRYPHNTKSVAVLQGKTLPELRIIRQATSLTVSGSKANLIERVSSWSLQKECATIQPTILGALMKSWITATFKWKACREGTFNELFICSNLPAFVLQKRMEVTCVPLQQCDIESLHEFGLLSHKDNERHNFLSKYLQAQVHPSTVFSVATVRSFCVAPWPQQ